MISIENETLANYIMFKLDKLENQFTEEELKNIDEIVLNPIDINGEYSEIDMNVIKYFSGLKKIYLRNIYLSAKVFNNLSELQCLKSVYLEKCEFVDEDLLADLNIEELEIINCNIDNYNFIYEMDQLISLSVVSGNVSIEKINKLKNLKYLELSYSTINDIKDIELPLLEKIYIDNTNIMDISIVKTLKSLKKISISEEQFIKNEKFIKELLKKEIIILNEGIVEFNVGGELND